MSQPVLTVFRVIAAVEALTWIGLLIGMFFKYVVVVSEIGVQIFGRLHGAAFVAYCAAALVAWIVCRWSPLTGLCALVAGVPPLGTVVFERWASLTGRIDRSGRTAEQADRGGPGRVERPQSSSSIR